MTCDNLLPADSRCSKGLPVMPLFRQFFCEARTEQCPFKVWEKSPTIIPLTKIYGGGL